MGLKKNNYELENFGITLPTAYAIINDIKISGETGIATFYIQSDRENAQTKKPLEIRTVEFTVDRKVNPYETAYKEATKLETATRTNPNTGASIPVEVKGKFVGWIDDIV